MPGPRTEDPAELCLQQFPVLLTSPGHGDMWREGRGLTFSSVIDDDCPIDQPCVQTPWGAGQGQHGGLIGGEEELQPYLLSTLPALVGVNAAEEKTLVSPHQGQNGSRKVRPTSPTISLPGPPCPSWDWRPLVSHLSTFLLLSPGRWWAQWQGRQLWPRARAHIPCSGSVTPR